MSDAAVSRPGPIARLLGDDGALMRTAFFLLLTGTVAVLYLDFRELMANDAANAVVSPLVPALPPFDPHSPNTPGPHLTTDRATLEAPLVLTLRGGGVLEATGTITYGAAQLVADEIAAHGEYITTVALDSPGGSVTDALSIGRLLREKGVATSVASGAFCASSCPLIFAGGVKRLAGTNAAIGIHQIYAAAPADQAALGPRASGIALSEAQKTTAEISRYLSAMGVDPAVWLHALETPPQELYYLSSPELLKFRVATSVSP